MIQWIQSTSVRKRPRPWLIAVVIGSIAIVAFVGTQYWSDTRMPLGHCNYLETLRPQNASADADKATAHGDHHLLGVYGYSLYVPGLDRAIDPRAYPVQPIDCTGDAWVSRRHEGLNHVADAYAERYNLRVLQGVAAKR